MAVLEFTDVLFECNDRTVGDPAMWYRSDRPITPVDGSDPSVLWELQGAGTTDFTKFVTMNSIGT